MINEYFKVSKWVEEVLGIVYGFMLIDKYYKWYLWNKFTRCVDGF